MYIVKTQTKLLYYIIFDLNLFYFFLNVRTYKIIFHFAFSNINLWYYIFIFILCIIIITLLILV